MRKIVRVVRELTAKADDQWSSLQGYADKRDAEDVVPYKVNVVLSDGCEKSQGWFVNWTMKYLHLIHR